METPCQWNQRQIISLAPRARIGSAFHRMEPRGRERHGRAAHVGERTGANESNALQKPPGQSSLTNSFPQNLKTTPVPPEPFNEPPLIPPTRPPNGKNNNKTRR